MYHHLNTGLEITKIKMILTTKHKSVSFGHNHCMAIWQKTTDYDFFFKPDGSPALFFLSMHVISLSSSWWWWWWLFRHVWGFGRMFDKLFSACVFLFCFLFKVEISLHNTNSTLYIRISPQWLSKLRRLWPSVPWWVLCELDFDRVFPDKLCVSLFLYRVPTLCLDSSIVSPLRLCWV